MHYPLFLDLTDRPVIVIGAGRVATRKVRSLLAARADVTVVDSRATAAVVRWARAGRLTWRRRKYRRGDLRKMFLAVAATDDLAVNERVCAEANRRRMLVNCAAPPAAGNFLVPALVRRGRMSLAISTGGGSPGVAKQVRRELEQYLRTGYGGFAKQIRARQLRTRSGRRRAISS